MNKQNKRSKEKREHPRFTAQFQAHCFHVLSDGTAEKVVVKVAGVWDQKQGKPQSKGMVRDISIGGLYLESVRAFREGTILVIELKVPSRKAKVVVIGLVRRVMPLKGQLPYLHGLGVQFIYMQKADWEALLETRSEGKK